jgi:hypothetical protein
MNAYQIHVDTGSVINVAGANTQPIVSKSNANPFQCSVLLGNRHRAFHEVSLANAQIPIGFYNVRAPYNTITIGPKTYTVTPGSYPTPTSFLAALNTATTTGVTSGAWALVPNTYQINYSEGSTSNTITVPTGLSYPSLASLLGFVPGQTLAGTSITSQNAYLLNFDTYLNIWIENIGPSSLEPAQITYKVPVNGAVGNVIYWNENSQFYQNIKVTDRNARVDRLNITVYDRFGNPMNNNGLDWSFSLNVKSDN